MWYWSYVDEHCLQIVQMGIKISKLQICEVVGQFIGSLKCEMNSGCIEAVLFQGKIGVSAMYGMVGSECEP